ncbi:MAG: VOC family protein [Gammaproteobacteria bacterium]
MVDILDIHHASLMVADTARSLAFYCDTLGLTTDDARPDLGYPGAWLWVGTRQIHLIELPNPDPMSGRPSHVGRDRHTALHIADMDSLRALFDQARIAYTLSRSGRRALFCRDPDGNGLEFIELAEHSQLTAKR